MVSFPPVSSWAFKEKLIARIERKSIKYFKENQLNILTNLLDKSI